jgi:hypothetical protein
MDHSEAPWHIGNPLNTTETWKDAVAQHISKEIKNDAFI